MTNTETITIVNTETAAIWGVAGERQAFENLRWLVTASETPDGVLIESATWRITGRRP